MMSRIYEELYKNNIQVVTIEQETNIKKYNKLVSYMENINSLVNESSDFVLCGKEQEKMLFDVLGKLLESLSRLMIILKKPE